MKPERNAMNPFGLTPLAVSCLARRLRFGAVSLIWISGLTASHLIGGTRVVAWGSNSFGQTNVPVDLTNVISVAAGDRFSLALRSDGTIANWGGYPYPNTNITDTLSNVVSISLQGFKVLALQQDGTVVSWAGSEFNSVPSGLTNVVSIASGVDHYLALKADGTVVAWGSNSSGQTNVPESLTNAVAIAAGLAKSFALKADGTVVAWGLPGASFPTNLTDVIAIAEARGSGIAVKSDGTINTWGAETNQSPVDITQAIGASVGGLTRALYVVQRNGRLAGWGGGVSHTNLWMNLTNVLSLDVGEFHSLAVVGDVWPETAPEIIGCNYHNNSFSVTQLTARGRSYVLEYKNSVSGTSWLMLPPAPGTGFILPLTDRNAIEEHRVYRTRVQP